MLSEKRENWIAVDWGTSNLRAWLMSDAEVVTSKTSGSGMATINADQFESELLALISDWLDHYSSGSKMTVVACGMVGARQGWKEAGYVSVPCSPTGNFTTKPAAKDHRIDVHILSGLSQSHPADVMRGEETQIAGFLSTRPGFSGTLCMPGTHSKWVKIDNGLVTGFSTAMTGEIYALLCDHSVLRHLVEKNGRDINSFTKGVEQARAEPDLTLNNLFALRARAVLNGVGKSETAAYLSGLLIGTELVSMMKVSSGSNVELLGVGALGELYHQAFEILGKKVALVDVSELTILGLIEAWKAHLESAEEKACLEI